tara:strand:+ start:738 stop:1463 length:726 start_codon:yes stop_codon:yes gene_type:complete
MFSSIRKYIKSSSDNKIALEIGGPTLLFTHEYFPNIDSEKYFELYSLFNSVDSVNLYNLESFQTVKKSANNTVYRTMYTSFDALTTKYDWLLSSHTIEHIANPIKFLKDYRNLLNDEGHIITFLPNKYMYWERHREFTTFEHIISDYENDVGEDDKTHIEENLIDDHPYNINPNHPDNISGLTWKQMCEDNEKHRGMHHHVYSADTCQKLHEYCGFSTIACFISPLDPLQIIYIGKNINNN